LIYAKITTNKTNDLSNIANETFVDKLSLNKYLVKGGFRGGVAVHYPPLDYYESFLI